MKYLLSHCDYIIRNNEPILVLKAVDENGDSKLFKKRGFKPYFYIPATEYNGVEDKKIRKTIYGKDVVKKEVQTPPEVNNIRDNYSKTWESDIRFPIRYMIDSGIKSGFVLDDQNNIKPEQVSVNDIMPTKLFFDIETSVSGDSVNFDPDKTDDRIVSIVCRYINENKSIDKEKVISDEDESIILDEFIQFVEDTDPEILLAWNIYFDIGNIYNRCKKHDVDISRLSPVGEVYKRGSGNNKEVVCKGRIVNDLMHSYDKFYTNRTLDSKALEDVCYDELGIEHSDFDYSKMKKDNWKDHIDEIVEYNALDVERMVELDQELEIVKHFEELRRATGCSFEQAHRTSGFVDVYVLRKCNDKFVLPKAGFDEKEKFKGGYVNLFKDPGVYTWVAVLDFSAHYPTGIKNHNISPETLVDEPEDAYTVDTPMGDVHFKKEPKGILPKMFEEIEETRNKFKRERDKYDKETEEWKYYHSRQYTMKQLINSFFGYFGFPGSRLYIPELAASVTAVGRMYIEETIDFLEENYNIETVYSDTDSVFIELQGNSTEEIVDKGKEIEDNINNFWKEKQDEEDLLGRPLIECEKIYKKLIYSRSKKEERGAKKKYAGRKIWEEGKFCDEFSATGFGIVRTDISEPTKEIQEKLLKTLVNDDEMNNDSSKVSNEKLIEMKEHIDQVKEKMKNPDKLEDIANPKSTRQKLEDAARPYSVHGMMWSNRNLGKQFGETESKAMLLYIDGFPDNEDYNTYIKCAKEKDGEPEFREVQRIALSPRDKFEEWKDYIDYDTHIEKQVKEKVETILDAVGLSYSEVVNGQRQVKLGNF